MSSQCLVTHAKEAARSENWALLNRYLQQLIHSDQEHSDHERTTETSAAEGASPELSPDVIDTLELLLYAMRVSDFQMRWELAKMLPTFGPEAIAPLVRLMDDATEEDDWEVIWFVIRILGDFQHPDAIAALTQRLSHSTDAELTHAAISALAHIGVSAIPVLKTLVSNPITRLPGVQALAQIRHPAIAEVLMPLVEDASDDVRAIAITALSSIRQAYTQEIRDILTVALRDRASSVRRAAVVGLGLRASDMAEDERLRLISPLCWDIHLEVRRQAVLALSRSGQAATATFLYTVLCSRDTPDPLKPDVVQAMMWTQTAESIEYLRQYVRTLSTRDLSCKPRNGLGADSPPSLALCRDIAASIGRTERDDLKPLATGVLVEMAFHNEAIAHAPEVKLAIAYSLGQLGDASAVQPLTELLSDVDERIRLHAAAALKVMGHSQFINRSHPISPVRPLL